MKLYSPCAVYLDEKDGITKQLTSYELETSLASCSDIVHRWENDCGYSLLVAYAQIYEDGKKVGIHEFTNSGNPEEWFRMARGY